MGLIEKLIISWAAIALAGGLAAMLVDLVTCFRYPRLSRLVPALVLPPCMGAIAVLLLVGLQVLWGAE